MKNTYLKQLKDLYIKKSMDGKTNYLTLKAIKKEMAQIKKSLK